MADAAKPEREPGAPIPRDQIDPDLIKLSRPKPKVPFITAAGVVILCIYFLVRLSPDRRFADEGEPIRASAADIVAGKIAEDTFVAVDVEPTMSQSIRVVKARGDLGHRLTPTRGTNEKLWIAFPGDGWKRPTLGPYTGRLRKLDDLPFADAARSYAASNPRPVFAAVAAVRAGLSTNQVTTVAGDTITLQDTDRVAFDTVDAASSTLVVTFTGPLKDVPAWTAELAKHAIVATPHATDSAVAPKDAKGNTVGQADALLGQARFQVALANAELTRRLEAAKLYASRVEPVTRHYETTWGALKASTPAGFVVGGDTIPDAQLDLVGFFVGRTIPSDAYALLLTERPADYWHVMPITVSLILIGLLFGWALVRAIRRDLLPPRA